MPDMEWTELKRNTVFNKYFRKIDQVRFKLPDGGETDFYLRSESPTVCIFGLTTEKEVILVSQYRPGPKMVLDELPGGYIEPGMSHIEAARKEFTEETGYDGNFEYVTACLDDAYSNMERFVYVATDCIKSGIIKNSETEQTETKLYSIENFRRLLKSGQMTDVEVGYLALDFLGLL